MAGFVFVTLLGALWLHYASPLFRFGRPGWLRAIAAVALANLGATFVILQFLVRPGLGPWTSGALFFAVGCAALALSNAAILRAAGDGTRPSLAANLGLSITTTAVTTAPGLIAALIPSSEAA